MAYFRKFFHFGLKAKYKYMLMFFGLAFLLAFCFFEMTSFASTPVDIIQVTGLDINNGVIQETSNTTHSIGYAYLYKGHTYTITNSTSSNSRQIGFLDTIPNASDTLSDYQTLKAGASFDFIATRDVIVVGNFLGGFEVVDNGSARYEWNCC